MRGVLQHNKNWLYQFPNFSSRTTNLFKLAAASGGEGFLNFVLFLYQKTADGNGHALWRVGWFESHDTTASLRGFVDFVLSEDDLSRCVSDTTIKPSTMSDATYICTYTKISFIWRIVVVSYRSDIILFGYQKPDDGVGVALCHVGLFEPTDVAVSQRSFCRILWP